jgi:hypothetical protein
MPNGTRPEALTTHAGVTVALRAATFAGGETSIAIRATTEIPNAVFDALGAFHGMRNGPTLFRLRDQRGRELIELPWTRSHAHVRSTHEIQFALFPPVPPDAVDFELEIPFAYLDCPTGRVDLDLPVREPVLGTLGRNVVHILRTRVSQATTGGLPPEPTIAIDVNLGGWQDDWRVLKPYHAELDGVSLGRFIWQMSASDPEPPQVIELPTAQALEARRLTLRGATVQVRGPWRLRFTRDLQPS